MQQQRLFWLTIVFIGLLSCDKGRRLPDYPDEANLFYRDFYIFFKDSATGTNLIGPDGFPPDSVRLKAFVNGTLRAEYPAIRVAGGQYALAYPYVDFQSYQVEKDYLTIRYQQLFEIHFPSTEGPDTLIVEKSVDSFVHFHYKGYLDTIISAFPVTGDKNKFIMEIRK